MKNIRRINLYGGPGSGKSTLAAEAFANLKKKSLNNNFNIELCTEYVKSWAWEKIKPKGFDQNYICAKQLRKEEILLRNNVDIVITDSPLLLQCLYAEKSGCSYAEHLFKIVESFESHYPSLNIFVERESRIYNPRGRYETENQAKEMDLFIKNKLIDNNVTIFNISHNDVEKLCNLVLENIHKG